MKRLLRLSLLTLTLSACSVAEPDRPFVARVDAPPSGVSVGEPLSAPISAKRTSSLAILSLPDEGPAPGKLTERQYANGWRQSVSLGSAKTEGDWNDLSIDIQTEPPETGRGAQIPMGKPSQEGIRHEIIARFPHTAMRIVTRPMRNALGPFGLAIGADAGDMRCAFAWQWVDDIHSAAKGGGSSLGGGAPASIRMRICRTGVTADQLANQFERLEITSENIDRVLEFDEAERRRRPRDDRSAKTRRSRGGSGQPRKFDHRSLARARCQNRRGECAPQTNGASAGAERRRTVDDRRARSDRLRRRTAISGARHPGSALFRGAGARNSRRRFRPGAGQRQPAAAGLSRPLRRAGVGRGFCGKPAGGERPAPLSRAAVKRRRSGRPLHRRCA